MITDNTTRKGQGAPHAWEITPPNTTSCGLVIIMLFPTQVGTGDVLVGKASGQDIMARIQPRWDREMDEVCPPVLG